MLIVCCEVTGEYTALPPCVAVIRHEPAPATVTVLPETEQTPGLVEAKVTANPDDALAVTTKGAAPNTELAGDTAEIVCALSTAKEFVTAAAAR